MVAVLQFKPCNVVVTAPNESNSTAAFACQSLQIRLVYWLRFLATSALKYASMAVPAAVDAADDAADDSAVGAALAVSVGATLAGPNIEARSGREQALKMITNRHTAARCATALARFIGCLIVGPFPARSDLSKRRRAPAM